MIAKITAVSGKRDEFIEVLTKRTYKMPGCFSYVVAKDSFDANVMGHRSMGQRSQSRVIFVVARGEDCHRAGQGTRRRL